MNRRAFPVLDFFRILSVALIAAVVGSEAFLNFPLYPDSFWQPQGLLRFFSLNPISPEAVRGVLIVFWIATVCGLLGLWTRTSLILIGISSALLFTLKMSFGYLNHRESALIVTFFILSAYPVGERLSLDAQIFKKHREASPQEVYGLLLCLRVLLCIVYFSAGLSKLQQSGWDWVTHPTLQYYLLFCDVTIPANWAQLLWPHAGYWLGLHPKLCHILSALVIFVELAAPLAFVRRLRYPIISGILFLQLSTLLFLKISFVHLTPLFLAWLPWEKRLHFTNAATK